MNIYDFLNSNLFQTISIFLTGYIAYLIYKQQKSDYKKSAATSILLEIQNAERVISKVRETLRNGLLEIDNIVMRSNSWDKYKYLFSRDFDPDEWEAISRFYNKSQLLDEAIKYNNISFKNDVEEIRANKQRILADYAKELIEEASGSQNLNAEELKNKFEQKVNVFDQVYMNKQISFAYKPQKPLNDAKIYLEDLNTLTTTTIGQKLKSMGG